MFQDHNNTSFGKRILSARNINASGFISQNDRKVRKHSGVKFLNKIVNEKVGEIPCTRHRPVEQGLSGLSIDKLNMRSKY